MIFKIMKKNDDFAIGTWFEGFFEEYSILNYRMIVAKFSNAQEIIESLKEYNGEVSDDCGDIIFPKENDAIGFLKDTIEKRGKLYDNAADK